MRRASSDWKNSLRVSRMTLRCGRRRCAKAVEGSSRATKSVAQAKTEAKPAPAVKAEPKKEIIKEEIEMPNFIMVCGPQAVGKMTVGQELAKLTGYKLFYNHMTIELLTKIFDYSKESYTEMTFKQFRDDVYAFATGLLDMGLKGKKGFYRALACEGEER